MCVCVWFCAVSRCIKRLENILNDGTHLLLYRVLCVCVCGVQFFAAPWTVAHQTPLSMEFSRQEYWSEFPLSTPGDLPNPGIKPTSLMCPAVADKCHLGIQTWKQPKCPLTDKWIKKLWSDQIRSVAQSCPTLCDPMNRSTPGLPVHHQLPELTQTHVHGVSDAIQPSHPLSSPSLPAPSPSQHQGLFQWVNSSHEVGKILEFQLQHQSLQWTPRTDLPESNF